MANQAIELSIKLHARSQPPGTYTYVITRSDDPSWAQWGTDYATPEVALKAGYEEAERWQKRLPPGTCIL